MLIDVIFPQFMTFPFRFILYFTFNLIFYKSQIHNYVLRFVIFRKLQIEVELPNSLELLTKGAFYWISPAPAQSYGYTLHHACSCIVAKQNPMLWFWINALTRGLSSYDHFVLRDQNMQSGSYTFETPVSLRDLAQTSNWGSNQNILPGSELRKRILVPFLLTFYVPNLGSRAQNMTSLAFK